MRLDPDDPLSEVLTIAEAAAEIDRDPSTVRHWISEGVFEPLRVPGSRRTWTTARQIREAERSVWLGSQGDEPEDWA